MHQIEDMISSDIGWYAKMVAILCGIGNIPRWYLPSYKTENEKCILCMSDVMI